MGTGWLLCSSGYRVKPMTAHHWSDSELTREKLTKAIKQSFPLRLSGKPKTSEKPGKSKVPAHVLEALMVLSPSREGRLTTECAHEGQGTPVLRSQTQLDSPLLCKKQEISHMVNAVIQKYPELGSSA